MLSMEKFHNLEALSGGLWYCEMKWFEMNREVEEQKKSLFSSSNWQDLLS